MSVTPAVSSGSALQHPAQSCVVNCDCCSTQFEDGGAPEATCRARHASGEVMPPCWSRCCVSSTQNVCGGRRRTQLPCLARGMGAHDSEHMGHVPRCEGAVAAPTKPGAARTSPHAVLHACAMHYGWGVWGPHPVAARSERRPLQKQRCCNAAAERGHRTAAP
jgi:hypothetical protein